MLRATLTYVERDLALTAASGLAKLDVDDVDFLMRHVTKLREEATAEGALLSRFHLGSGLPDLLDKLRLASPEEFVEVSASLALRLQGSMDQATNPKVGVLAVLASGEGDGAQVVSVLKLDAISEAASYRLEDGQVRMTALRDLLPAPGHLQKGISWPDPRDGSEAIVIDRNVVAAKYFFNAYELQVSSTSSQAERALSEAIFKTVPKPRRAEAVQYASTLSRQAEEVVAELRSRYPEIGTDQAALGSGEAVGGFIRQSKVAGYRVRYMADGIMVVVPWDRLGQLTGPRQAGGGWEMAIRFTARPQEDVS